MSAGTISLALPGTKSATEYRIVAIAPRKEHRTFAWSVKKVPFDKHSNTVPKREAVNFHPSLLQWLELDVKISATWTRVSASPASHIQNGTPVVLTRHPFDHETRFKSDRDDAREQKKKQNTELKEKRQQEQQFMME